MEDELLCPVKCIHAQLARRFKIVSQDFTKFLITFGKPRHPAPKDSLAQLVKKVIGNSGTDTVIFNPLNARAGSNSAAFELGMHCRRY